LEQSDDANNGLFTHFSSRAFSHKANNRDNDTIRPGTEKAFLPHLSISWRFAGTIQVQQVIWATRPIYQYFQRHAQTTHNVQRDYIYVKSMVNDFPEPLKGVGAFLWTNKMFTVDFKSKKLDKKRAAIFHTFVMKGMFLCKRGRQDIQPGIAFLATRTSEPNEGDWAILKKLMVFLKVTQDNIMLMSADDSATIKWMIDAAFAVHPDMKSHTGATLSLGTGVICSVSRKQKRNSRSSSY
jgi:hypothetical protein